MNMQHGDPRDETISETVKENQTASQSYCGDDLCRQSLSDHLGGTRSP